MKQLALKLIKLYQATISQVTPPSCRYLPTCSQYAYEAIGKYGLFKGSGMAAGRICRCHPWSQGGYDPVP